MKRITFIFFLLAVLGMILPFTGGCGVQEGSFSGVVTLRSQFKELTEKEVKGMLKKYSFFDSRRNSRQDFPNKFELIETQKTEQFRRNPKTTVESTIWDKATGLVWLQSGSAEAMTSEEAIDWTKKLNQQGYGGYNNWRIPTLEEAASLLESRKIKNRHIATLFSNLQHSIMSSDSYDRTHLWGISFQLGSALRIGLYEPNYVRLVTHFTSK